MAASWGVGPAVADGTGGTTIGGTLNGCTAGRSLIFLVRWHASVDLSSITISGETVDIHGSELLNASLAMSWQIASCKKLASGGNKTFTATFTGNVDGTNQVWVREAAGLDVDGTTILDVEGGSTGNSANGAHTLAVTGDNCLMIAGHTNDSQDATGVSSGFTGIALSNEFWLDHGAEDVDVGAAGNKTITFTHTSGNWMVKAAAFLIPTAILIDDQPDSTVNLVGETATFNITASGGVGTLHYQWQRDSGGGFSNVGSDQNNYTTEALDLADNGNLIRCTVTDDSGSLQSDTVMLSVEAERKIRSNATPLRW